MLGVIKLLSRNLLSLIDVYFTPRSHDRPLVMEKYKYLIIRGLGWAELGGGCNQAWKAAPHVPAVTSRSPFLPLLPSLSSFTHSRLW